ncbi:protein rep, partial [Fibrella forsythiae]
MHKDKATLLRRARAKYISKSLSSSLLRKNPDSPLKNSYYGSLLCSHNLYQAGQRITTSYCKQRWCAVCNRIRTAKLIGGYLPTLKGMKDPQFVTLTKQTVPDKDLVASMDLMEKVWRQILRSDANKKRKIKGIRKGECTIRPNNHYHFHYHVIVDGRENAEWLIDAWLTRLKGVADAQAQNYRRADENSLKEMFKYFTKLIVSTADHDKQLYPADRMDVIFLAMKGRRTIQPFGGLHAVADDIDDLVGQVYESLEGADQVWKWSDTD